LSRVERRRKQRRQRRWRRGGVLGALAVVAVIAVVVATVTLVNHSGNHKSATPKRTQRTTLFAIRGPDGTAVESALFAHDPKTHKGVVLLVPARVIADVPGHGSVPFGDSLQTGDPRLAEATLSDLIGVTIDGGWVVSEAALAKFIDLIGGITVTVDTNVLRPTKNGGAIVVVPAGANQHLRGSAAVAYATYGVDEYVRLSRFQAVLQGILASLHASGGTATHIAAVGPGSQLTTSAASIASILDGVAADSSLNVDYNSLPTNPVDVGGGPTTYTLDRTKTSTFVNSDLKASIPSGLQGPGRVVSVINGVGTIRLAASTRAKLIRAGFAFTDGGNDRGFTYRNKASAVLIRDASDAARENGYAVAKALGLPQSDVHIYTRKQSTADVIVILGRDYKR
jgi:anionic cell wall polymer biosynthesis LytR-Cps2A-Psr (LCP) family protein